MEEKTKQDFIQFLKKSTNVFASSHENMHGIDPSVIDHRLSVSSSYKPVRQRRRVFTPEWDNVIKEEVYELITTEFFRKIYYLDWLANVVMVKKVNGKWRMCLYLIDLNKTCPKDRYPLSRIDQLVDSTVGHDLLSFMDVFLGYNQIKMDEAD